MTYYHSPHYMGGGERVLPMIGRKMTEEARPVSGFGSQAEYEQWKREHDAQPAPSAEPGTTNTLTRDEVNQLIADAIAERDKIHAQETAKLRAQVPQLVVPAHGGGPGNDNHRPSWNLAEQEAARRGEDLDHWHDD